MTVIKILNSPKATIIPCIHEESGCSGLFNTITNEFYPVKTTEVEYIQSAETQYIDTGVQPKGGRMKKVNTYCDHCGRVIDIMHDYDDLQIDMEHKRLIVDLCTECFDELHVLVSDYCKKEDA